ncbi:hypothetical protein [Streptomyces sp. TBY4]|uniref:hypothetical protein n=1 Tax=Streptomyces sp. TBY4 TaxID=2962030 RepID=UPI0020B668F9|nr:hypothetical protein [Streptomyces sp. TBY4]MCP3758187.1 hypothetical protein [Streptomyces sp. TBY4]
MIINLTGEDIRVYGPDAPDVITDDVLHTGCTVIAAEAELPPAHLGFESVDLDEPRTTLHGGQRLEIHLVRYLVRDLPAYRPGTYLLVDPAIGACVRGRADLLVPLDQVHDATGAPVGYRYLVSPC